MHFIIVGHTSNWLLSWSQTPKLPTNAFSAIVSSLHSLKSSLTSSWRLKLNKSWITRRFQTLKCAKASQHIVCWTENQIEFYWKTKKLKGDGGGGFEDTINIYWNCFLWTWLLNYGDFQVTKKLLCLCNNTHKNNNHLSKNYHKQAKLFQFQLNFLR